MLLCDFDTVTSIVVYYWYIYTHTHPHTNVCMCILYTYVYVRIHTTHFIVILQEKQQGKTVFLSACWEKKTCLMQAKKPQPQIMTNSISNAAAALLTP